MSRKNVDLSELYDLIKSRADCYVMCFDMVCLMPINDNYGYEAGDKAILECLRRIDSLSDESCILFRIGGDEFALVTDLKDPKEVEQLAKKILGENGQPILYNNLTIPISMRVGCTRITGSNIKYNNLSADLFKAIDNAKVNPEFCFIN